MELCKQGQRLWMDSHSSEQGPLVGTNEYDTELSGSV